MTGFESTCLLSSKHLSQCDDSDWSRFDLSTVRFDRITLEKTLTSPLDANVSSAIGQQISILMPTALTKFTKAAAPLHQPNTLHCTAQSRLSTTHKVRVSWWVFPGLHHPSPPVRHFA